MFDIFSMVVDLLIMSMHSSCQAHRQRQTGIPCMPLFYCNHTVWSGTSSNLLIIAFY